MSDDEAKQRRKIQASQKREQAKRLEGERTTMQSKKKELEEKIEKLEKAKQGVTTALSSLSGFSSGLSSLKSSGGGSFKGDRKDKYVDELETATSKLSKYESSHKENKTKIEEKLKNLKEDQQRLSMSIGALDVRIGSLYSAAAQLDC
ncbi:DUF5082 family protein [Enterococcus gilvus]|uniref:DUF5082 family protein n=1 Tax=Enterococcus gilvus TaxID=160453 RepID=UPI001C8CF303|nr:DUF5082 family protein [Enterococcus gilvus]MBX8935567.1 DUF5082 family protein [Enterococcus gilvus]